LRSTHVGTGWIVRLKPYIVLYTCLFWMQSYNTVTAIRLKRHLRYYAMDRSIRLQTAKSASLLMASISRSIAAYWYVCVITHDAVVLMGFFRAVFTVCMLYVSVSKAKPVLSFYRLFAIQFYIIFISRFAGISHVTLFFVIASL